MFANCISRLEAATGPDRELDAEIMFDLYAKPVGEQGSGNPIGYLWPEDNPSWNFGIRFPGKDKDWFFDARQRMDGETLVIWRDEAWVLMNSLRIPKLTSSIDSALVLVEREVPKAFLNLQGPFKYLHIPTPAPDRWRAALDAYPVRYAPTAPLAVLKALFSVTGIVTAQESQP